MTLFQFLHSPFLGGMPARRFALLGLWQKLVKIPPPAASGGIFREQFVLLCIAVKMVLNTAQKCAKWVGSNQESINSTTV